MTYNHQSQCLAHDLIKQILCLAAADHEELGDKKVLPTGIIHEGVLFRTEERFHCVL